LVSSFSVKNLGALVNLDGEFATKVGKTKSNGQRKESNYGSIGIVDISLSIINRSRNKTSLKWLLLNNRCYFYLPQVKASSGLEAKLKMRTMMMNVAYIMRLRTKETELIIFWEFLANLVKSAVLITPHAATN
jgi:hypothetical protein